MKSKHLNFVILVLLIIGSVLISGCAQQEIPAETPAGKSADVSVKPYEPEQPPPEEEKTGTIFHKDFTAVMPKGWKEVEIPPATYIYLPSEGDYTDPRSENINFAITNLPEDYKVNLQEITEKGVEESKRLLPDLTLTEGPVEAGLGPISGLKIKFEVTIAGEKMAYTQLIAEKFNSLYTATHSCPIADCRYDDEFNAMVKSLEPHDAKAR